MADGQTVDISNTEEWADGFMFWVYDAFTPDNAGMARNLYLTQLAQEGFTIAYPQGWLGDLSHWPKVRRESETVRVAGLVLVTDGFVNRQY